MEYSVYDDFGDFASFKPAPPGSDVKVVAVAEEAPPAEAPPAEAPPMKIRTLAPPRPPEPIFPQRPMQTVHQRTTPLTPDELETARGSEAARKVWDTYYITAAEAHAIPREAMTPELDARIKYSQRDWPENRMSLSDALGPLPTGTGEQYLQRGMDVDEVFWTPGPDAQPAEHALRGRRMERSPRPYR